MTPVCASVITISLKDTKAFMSLAKWGVEFWWARVHAKSAFIQTLWTWSVGLSGEPKLKWADAFAFSFTGCRCRSEVPKAFFTVSANRVFNQCLHIWRNCWAGRQLSEEIPLFTVCHYWGQSKELIQEPHTWNQYTMAAVFWHQISGK